MPGDDAPMRISTDSGLATALRRALPLLLLASVAASGSARAEINAGLDVPPDPLDGTAPSPITDHFVFRVDQLQGTVATDGVVYDPSLSTTGTPFSAEKDLHLTPRARQLRAEFLFRLRTRSQLRVDMWELNRQGEATPTFPITYGGNVFQVSDVVDTRLDWRQIDLTYTYSFIRRSSFELAAGLGLHLLQTEAEARVPARRVREDFSASGPFPTLALDATWRISRRFAFEGRAQYFKLTVSSVSGSMADYSGNFQYRWKPNLAVGLGYRSQQIHVAVANNNPNGQLDLNLKGPSLFLRASF
jgi:hypothetical protein